MLEHSHALLVAFHLIISVSAQLRLASVSLSLASIVALRNVSLRYIVVVSLYRSVHDHVPSS